MIKDGVAKVADFGLAGEPGRAESIAGTPGYIAPEIAVGIRSPSGDVFALTATAWACLFGVAPFGSALPVGDASAAIALLVQRAIDGEYVADVRKHKGVPRMLRPVLRSALDPDPNRRPPLDVWLVELVAVLESSDWLTKLRRRLPTLILGAGASIALGLAAFAVAEDRPQRTSDVAAPTKTSSVADQVAMVEGSLKSRDADAALNALHNACNESRDWESEDLVKLGDVATRVAETLEELQQHEDAITAWFFAVRLYKRAKQKTRVETAQNSLRAAFKRVEPTGSDPSRSR